MNDYYDTKKFSISQRKQLEMCKKMDFVEWKNIANPKFDHKQMKEIRLGMAKKIDYKVYLDANLPAKIMYAARKELMQKGTTTVVSAYKISQLARKQGYGVHGAKIIYKAALENINMLDYLENDGKLYNLRHLQAIKVALLIKNPDVDRYLSKNSNWRELISINAVYKKTNNADFSKKYNSHQLMQINAAMRRNIDLLQYVDEKYNWRKMQEIRYGLQDGLDVSNYLNAKYNSFQMREIRLALKEGINLTVLCEKSVSWQSINQLRKLFGKLYDISEYTVEQLKEIMRCLQKKFDVREVAVPGFDVKELRALRLKEELPLYIATE